MDKAAILSELKSSFENPRLYLVNNFDALRNLIDIECENHLIKHEIELTEEDKKKVYENQNEMIKTVDEFQKQCLFNLDMVQSDLLELTDLKTRLNNLDSWVDDVFYKVERDLHSALYQRKKLLFMKQGLIFFTIDEYETNIQKIEINHKCLFGILVIADEFVSYDGKLTNAR